MAEEDEDYVPGVGNGGTKRPDPKDPKNPKQDPPKNGETELGDEEGNNTAPIIP